MNYYEAHKILDRAKDGQPTSEIQIIKALEMTGDISEDDASRAIEAITSRHDSNRARRSARVVQYMVAQG